jgi:hypothetical protein
MNETNESETRRVVVSGATGLIGKKLCEQLTLKGYELVVLSRNPEKARKVVPGAAVAWEPSAEPGAWASVIDGAYGVVHLAGAPVFGPRWTEKYKQEIRDSRVLGTRGLVAAMRAAEKKPAVFVCGSAIGYYGFRGDEELDESGAPGDDFLAQVTVEWEQAGAQAEQEGIRTVLLRTGAVLDVSEGALPTMLPAFQLFMGGPILPGTQWFSWVHIDDEVGLIMLALEDERARGPLNATAPTPQTNRDFSATLGKVIGRPSWLPVPKFALIALLGEVGNMVAEGQRVIPRKALDLGYKFRYTTSEEALRQLLGR